jgi:peptide/nickel transport system permease protein
MWQFILRRSAYSVLIILGVMLLTFILFNLSSGDPAAAVLGKDARPEEVESLRTMLGSNLPLLYGKKCVTESYKFQEVKDKNLLQVKIEKIFEVKDPVIAIVTFSNNSSKEINISKDKKSFYLEFPKNLTVKKVDFYRLQNNPWNSQFVKTLSEIISFKSTFPYVEFFNFGKTLSTRESIKGILARSIVPPILLMFPIFIGEMLFGVIFALVATAFRDKWPDRMLVFISVIGMSISYLVFIIGAQWFLGYYLELFPLWGYDSIANLGLPVTVGILSGIGSNVRFYRTVFVDELRKEYLRTAIAKGVHPTKVFGIHLLRNAALQIITKTGSTLPFLFTGSLLLESFFGIPGLGFAGVEALYNSDLQLLKAIVLLSALLFVFINLLTDLAYAWADPRIRLE